MCMCGGGGGGGKHFLVYLPIILNKEIRNKTSSHENF